MKPNNLALTRMASLCWKIKDDPRFKSVVGQAQELNQEWTILSTRYASAGYTAELNRQMELEAQVLIERMVELLEEALGLLTVL
jgi:hypothetical protein